jgi:hypothetical protein
MRNIFKHNLVFFYILFVLINILPAKADNFNNDLREIRAEINRDNLKDAIKKLRK